MKKPPFYSIIIVIILILLILLFKVLIPNYGLDLYGNRLNGVSSYPIDNSIIDGFKGELKGLDGVKSVEYLLEGKLIDIIIKVDDSLNKDTAKSYADKILPHFSDEEKGYYDIEVMINSENSESEAYPIIGYKHKTSESFKWSNN